VLERLDRLTREEAQTTATQTLGLVYCLVKNIKIVMDGTHGLFVLHAVLINAYPFRGKRVDGWCLSNSRYVLLVGCGLVINSNVSTHPAARERHKQGETCVIVLVLLPKAKAKVTS
jgi:hypothetical protein